MGKVKKGLGTTASVLFGGLGILIYLTLGILGAVIHVFTILVAFSISGILGAVLSLGLPVLAQIYWFIRLWYITGTVWNPYCLAIMAYVGLVAILVVGVLVWVAIAER